MEVKIGIHSVPRELVVETDTPAEEVERLLSAALEKGEHAVIGLLLVGPLQRSFDFHQPVQSAQQSGRLAVGVAVDLAAAWIGRIVGHACQ